jgi:hypothetical protein
MPENNSPMQGMMPAFMNTPQYQQQMQGLAMQLRQQEDGIKRTKKFLKAYEDIQLNQPIPQQQPAFMQPPGGMVQAQNQGGQQGMEGDAGSAGEAGTPSPAYDPTPGTTKFPNTLGKQDFIKLGGGSDGSKAGDYGAFARGRQINAQQMEDRNQYGANTPEGTDPGLAAEGNRVAAEPQVQRERLNANQTLKQHQKNMALKDSGRQLNGFVNAANETDKMLETVKKELKHYQEMEGPDGSASVATKKKLGEVKKLAKQANDALVKANKKYQSILNSTPNKAMGLGLGVSIGGALMSDAYAADAAQNSPEMAAGRNVDQGSPGRNDNPRTAAAHQAYLEQQAKTGNYMVNRKPGSRGQQPIEYSAAEDVRAAQ